MKNLGGGEVCVNVVVHHNTCIQKEKMPTMLFGSPQTSNDMQMNFITKRSNIMSNREYLFLWACFILFLFGLMLAPISSPRLPLCICSRSCFLRLDLLICEQNCCQERERKTTNILHKIEAPNIVSALDLWSLQLSQSFRNARLY